MAEVRKLAESYGADEEQLPIFQEIFAFLADSLGVDMTKEIMGTLYPSVAGSVVELDGGTRGLLASGIVRGYLSNAKTVLTEDFLDEMCRQALEFGYNLGRYKAK